MTTQELVQAASHIASGMLAAEYCKGQIAPQTVDDIVRLSVSIVRDIEVAARKPPPSTSSHPANHAPALGARQTG